MPALVGKHHLISGGILRTIYTYKNVCQCILVGSAVPLSPRTLRRAVVRPEIIYIHTGGSAYFPAGIMQIEALSAGDIQPVGIGEPVEVVSSVLKDEINAILIP